MAMLGAAALLLFGPEQLPRVARKAGGFMRDIQNTSQSFIREMERAADLQDVAAKVVPPPYEPAAYDPAPYEAADEHVADGTPAYEPEPYESEPEPYDVTAHPAAATYEPPAPDPEAPVRRTVSVAEKVAEPRPALGLVEPSAPAEAPPQTNHTAHL
jgi:Sec-independent protein translocase protein TatA